MLFVKVVGCLLLNRVRSVHSPLVEERQYYYWKTLEINCRQMGVVWVKNLVNIEYIVSEPLHLYPGDYCPVSLPRKGETMTIERRYPSRALFPPVTFRRLPELVPYTNAIFLSSMSDNSRFRSPPVCSPLELVFSSSISSDPNKACSRVLSGLVRPPGSIFRFL